MIALLTEKNIEEEL